MNTADAEKTELARAIAGTICDFVERRAIHLDAMLYEDGVQIYTDLDGLNLTFETYFHDAEIKRRLDAAVQAVGGSIIPIEREKVILPTEPGGIVSKEPITPIMKYSSPVSANFALAFPG